MSGYHIQRPWQSFVYQGTIYDLTHLNEYHLSASDSEGEIRQILITFSDHCFTRKYLPGDSSELIYPSSTRCPGCFCHLRYRHSHSLLQHIESAKTGTVWNVEGDNLALVPVITNEGTPVHYAIVFRLIPLKGSPFHLHMKVLSAHICDASKEFVTHGSVGFKKLLSLKIARKQLARNTNQNRKRPSPPK